MDTVSNVEGLIALAKGLAIIGVIGSGIGIGLIGKGALEAIGRNPAAFGKTFMAMLLAIAMCELPALLAFASLFIIK